ncbi:MAG: HupE/UreJ family protein [Pseudomonadota bacterium]
MLTCLAVVFSATTAAAHRIDESYVYFQVSDEALTGRIEVTAKDLAQAFEFDGTGVPDQSQIAAREGEIFDYLSDRLLLLANGRSYPIRYTGLDFLETEIATFALFSFDIPELGPTPDSIDIAYDFLFSDIDPGHRGFALIESNTRTGVSKNESHISLAFQAGMAPQTLNLTADPLGAVFASFLQHGIWHVWHGIDQLLFLTGLLLTATMVRERGRWAPTSDLQGSLVTMVFLVTAFTVGHLITMSLVAFGVFRLPSTYAEAAIAASIVLIALGNLVPQLRTRSWIVILIFGMCHGFGYVSVLPLLGSEVAQRTVALGAFHAGLEIGQLAIVLIAFPILFLLREWRVYRFLGLQMGSVALIAIAAVWFAERTYNFLGPVRQTLAGLVG